jgi:hypothetical protein
MQCRQWSIEIPETMKLFENNLGLVMAFCDIERIKQSERQLFQESSISLDLQWRLYSGGKEQAKVQNRMAFGQMILSITGLEFRSQLEAIGFPSGQRTDASSKVISDSDSLPK